MNHFLKSCVLIKIIINNKNYDFKDSLEINLKLSNQVEEYSILNSFKLSESVIDTLPPNNYKKNINNNFLLQFSDLFI